MCAEKSSTSREYSFHSDEGNTSHLGDVTSFIHSHITDGMLRVILSSSAAFLLWGGCRMRLKRAIDMDCRDGQVARGMKKLSSKGPTILEPSYVASEMNGSLKSIEDCMFTRKYNHHIDYSTSAPTV